MAVRTADGLTLEAELAVPDAPVAAAVLTHPHPQYGGDMRSLVTGALYAALPRAGVAALRFNFRGVGDSEGSYGGGVDEQLDVAAAISSLADEIDPAVPLVLAGYSFGANVAAAVTAARLAGWYLVAPPPGTPAGAGADPRPKLLAVPEHDQYRSPASAASDTAGWANTRIEVLPGADHFLVGSTDRVVELAVAFIMGVTDGQ